MSTSLPRVHLFEFNDAAWAPEALRATIVESLSRTLAWGRMLRGLTGPFEAFLTAAGATEVLDVCAGAGGPARILVSEIARAGRTPPRFILTDLHPQLEAWEAAHAAFPGVIDFERESVDATCIPEALGRGRVRTIVNAFHHFPPELARGILANAVAGSAGVFVAESFERNPLGFGSMVPAGLAALLLNPLLSPRDRLKKAALTWMTPVAIAASTWDGVVSTLRVYNEAELREMVAPLGGDFEWTYGTYDYAFGGLGYYFHGVPRTRREPHEALRA